MLLCKYCHPRQCHYQSSDFFLYLPKLNLREHKPLSLCLSFSSSFIHPSLLVSTILDTSYTCNHVYLSCCEGTFHSVIILKVGLCCSYIIMPFPFCIWSLLLWENTHTLTKRNLGEERKGLFQLAGCRPSLRELGNSSGNWSRNHEGMLLAGYLSGSCLGNFLMQFRVTCPGSGTAHSGLDLYQLAIRTVPHSHPTDQSDKDTELRLFSGVLVCYLEN